MKFIERERARATGWKRSSDTLPDTARSAAHYVDKHGAASGPERDYCLPRELAALSLLPEVRDTVLPLFVELGIPWHAGVDGGPSNHLLSSQVQCANALGQMVTDPARLVAAFATPLGVAEPMFVEPERYLTFEYIGPEDYLNESKGRARTRGAHCTSVDAAFLHRHVDGFVELVLLEWKYTESYGSRAAPAGKTEKRRLSYEAAIQAADGPVDPGSLAFEALTDEPLYQLVRQQLLAYELEKRHVLGAERVRVVHVSMPDNVDYQASLRRPELRAMGATVDGVWQALLRRPDRFVSLNSSLFLDPTITSAEYDRRYGDRVFGGPRDVVEFFELEDLSGLEDALFETGIFEGDVQVFDDERIDLYVGPERRSQTYPFTLGELRADADELERWDPDDEDD